MTPVPHLDESTLAAFLAGTLSAQERERVMMTLAQDAEARELVRMASDMLAAASVPEPTLRRARPAKPAADRGAFRPLRRVQRRVVLAAVTLFAAVGLTFSLSMPDDNVRTEILTPEQWRATIEVEDVGEIAWQAVPDAETYRIVVWSLGTADPVVEIETALTDLDGDPSAAELAAISGEHVVRIYALDGRGRQVLDSGNMPLGDE